MSAVVADGVDVVVIVSPHGEATGVHATVNGSLRPLGVPGVAVERLADGLAVRALARAWGRPLLDGGIDHGLVVPLALLDDDDRPVVAVALGESDDPIAQARSLSSALAEVFGDRSIAVLASANTSIALSARAPLTERAEARAVESRLLARLQRDARAAADLAPAVARDGGSCGAGPLTIFGELCAGEPVEVLAYEVPVGVGYLVARAGMAWP
jgi:hypothetical protein